MPLDYFNNFLFKCICIKVQKQHILSDVQFNILSTHATCFSSEFLTIVPCSGHLKLTVMCVFPQMSGGWYSVILQSLVWVCSLWCLTSSSWLNTTVSTDTQHSTKLLHSNKKTDHMLSKHTITREQQEQTHAMNQQMVQAAVIFFAPSSHVAEFSRDGYTQCAFFLNFSGSALFFFLPP